MTRLTISIVNYNGGKYLIDCLRSIEKVKKEAEITTFVVDNNSKDKSIERAQNEFKDILFIKNRENLGFGKAHNQVLKKINTEYVLILNPDSKLIPGTIKYMIEFMDKNPEVGAASCKVEKNDGSIDWASHRGFPTPWASFLYYVLGDGSLYHLTKKDLTKAHEVDAIVGAFFLTRRSVLDKVGLFDEDYFMYGEDIDLCMRIKRAGYKVMYIPEVKILHYKGLSSGLKKHSQQISTVDEESKIRAFNAFYNAMKIFYKKHYQRKYPWIINWLVNLGIDIKWWFARRRMVV